jgi:hypothetical protein
MPPWDDPATRAEFARERRALAGWSAAGLALCVLGLNADSWLGSRLAHANGVWIAFALAALAVGGGLFAALARYDTCPFCGRSFAVPDDEDRQASGSWNHCYSCKVRIR